MKYLMSLVYACAVLAATAMPSAAQGVDSFAACNGMFPGGVVPASQSETGIDFLKNLPLTRSHDAEFWGVELPDTPSDCR